MEPAQSLCRFTLSTIHWRRRQCGPCEGEISGPPLPPSLIGHAHTHPSSPLSTLSLVLFSPYSLGGSSCGGSPSTGTRGPGDGPSERQHALPRRRLNDGSRRAGGRRSALPPFVPIERICCFPYLHCPSAAAAWIHGAVPRRGCPSVPRLWRGRASARWRRGSSGASSLSCGSCLGSDSVCVRASAEPILLLSSSLVVRSQSLSWSFFSIDGQIYSTVEESSNYGTVGSRHASSDVA